jgi:hypothetical protein
MTNTSLQHHLILEIYLSDLLPDTDEENFNDPLEIEDAIVVQVVNDPQEKKKY